MPQVDLMCHKLSEISHGNSKDDLILNMTPEKPDKTLEFRVFPSGGTWGSPYHDLIPLH